VCARLGDYFVRKADPTGGGRWEGESRHYFADIVYYQLRALRVRRCLQGRCARCSIVVMVAASETAFAIA
jgi:hypothetical protein